MDTANLIETVPDTVSPITVSPIQYKTSETSLAPLSDWSTEARVVIWLILAAGVLFRVASWWHGRSLWLDELYITQSIISRSWHDLLFKELDYWQGAPAGFLSFEWLSVQLFGTGERALRLPSLIAGLSSLPLFYNLARRLLSVRGALLAVLIFCSVQPLVYYSEEVKQYAFDVTFTLAIFCAALLVWDTAWSARSLFVYAATGALALFCSHPAVIVLTGTTLILFLTPLFEKTTPAKLRSHLMLFAIALAALWLPLEWLNYHYFLLPLIQHKEAHDGLVQYWRNADGFLPKYPNQAVAWIWSTFHKLIHDSTTMYIEAADLGMFLGILGLAALLLKSPPWRALLILSPLPLAIGLSHFERYPFADRLALYAIPGIVLWLAHGLDTLWGERGFHRMLLALVAGAMLLGSSVHRVCYELANPVGREETRPIYAFIKKYWTPGDLIFLTRSAAPSYDYYAPRSQLGFLKQLWQTAEELPLSASDTPLHSTQQGGTLWTDYRDAFTRGTNTDLPNASGYVAVQLNRSKNPGAYLQDIEQLFNPPLSWNWPKIHRVWVVFDHVWDDTGRRVDDLCKPEFDCCADMRLEHHEDGVATYLYELTGTTTVARRE